ncbi:MAG: tetratricopeptide repeat protein [Phycisphaerales bacterium]|nr:tetratricopeptide repeat protein [Phycisphaerales bacterium]
MAQTSQERPQLETGIPAPALSCTALNNQIPDLRAALGHPVILLFGELYNDRSVAAASDVAKIAALQEFAQCTPQVWMIAANQPAATESGDANKAQRPELPICRDAKRQTYADYGVHVLPTTVVIDTAGKVLYVLSGKPFNYADLVADACRAAAGLLSPEAFKSALAAQANTKALAAHQQAETLAQMAQRLQRLGKHGLAEDKFKEALKLAPASHAARSGLGRCYLEQARLAEAEEQFRQVLASAPEDADANLGLAAIALARGGDEVPRAGTALAALLARRPRDAELNFMMGRIEEVQNHTAEAMEFYKRAAQALLEQPNTPEIGGR